MDDERLIVEVQRHEIIYATKHPFYKDNGRKDKVWNLIGVVLGMDGEYKVLLYCLLFSVCKYRAR